MSRETIKRFKTKVKSTFRAWAWVQIESKDLWIEALELEESLCDTTFAPASR